MELSMQMRQSLGLRLEQRLSPQLIQSMEILQLPMMELRARIDKELLENPTLEIVDEDESPLENAASEEDTSDREEKELEYLENLDEEWNRYFQATSRPRSHSGENDVNQALANTAARPETLQEYLAEQVRMIDLPDDLADLAESIVYSIDDSGYLRYPLKEITETSDGKYTLRQARDMLRIIQSVGALGVGARDLTECLLLQLDGKLDDFILEKLMITYHLEDIEHNRLPKIAKETERTIEDVKEAYDHIAHLNPRPGEILTATHARYIFPDIVVKYVDGRYEIALQDSYLPVIRISPNYRKMLKAQGRDPEVLKYVRNRISAGDWLISSLEQRRNTLQRIGTEIVRVQKNFFEEGIGGLRPLRMQDVADVIGVHVATVSRAAADKYMDTPRGVYPLKFFFTGGFETSEGKMQARRSVEEEIKEFIDSENKHRPISDGDIVKKLKENGTSIARRTVAKYRNKMSIPAASLRKEH